MMRFLYIPAVNALYRKFFYLFRKFLPDKLCIPVYGPEKIKIFQNKHIILDANPTSYVLKILYWKGIEAFEYRTQKVLCEMLPEKGIFLDIGANIGYYSLLVRSLRPSMNILAFEPLPSAFSYLKRNCSLNNFTDIRCFPIALSDSNETSEFYTHINPKFHFISEHLHGDSSLNQSASGSVNLFKIRVSCQTLDDFMNHHLPDFSYPVIIKMDVEGAENRVLSGGLNFIQKHKPIILCEIIHGLIEKEMENLIKILGYEIYEPDLNFKLKKINKISVTENKNDFFLIHPDTISYIPPALLTLT